jgi:hypothetical protein
MISPLKWQNRLACRTKGDKKVTKSLAIKLFPFLSKTLSSGERKSTVTLDTADALLIGLYGYLEYANPKFLPINLRSYIKAPTPAPIKRKGNALRSKAT